GIPWEEHLGAENTFRVDATLRVPEGSPFSHSQYIALRIKDAVVDRFRSRERQRPSVDRERPDLHINAHVRDRQATLSLDLGGGSLHQRSYRRMAGDAPLKENLAAAILIRSGWPELAK